MVQRMLADVTATPLPGGHRLSDISRGNRLVELEFSLPSAGLDAAQLAATLRRHGYEVGALGFAKLQGYLRGFIDLVYQHQGRFYVLDWKSNHLGWSAADYGAESLRRAIQEQGYHLQYLLYTVALHRYLRQRLRGYDYDQHVGGVNYVFLRGVRPAWTQVRRLGRRRVLPQARTRSHRSAGCLAGRRRAGMNPVDDLAPDSRDDPAVESRSDPAAERLAEGFAQHVERWARRLGCDEKHSAGAAAGSLRNQPGHQQRAHVCILLVGRGGPVKLANPSSPPASSAPPTPQPPAP